VACGHGMLGWKAVGRLGLRGVRHEGKVPQGQAQGPREARFRTGSCVWQLEVGLCGSLCNAKPGVAGFELSLGGGLSVELGGGGE
jgi:hypothetical protein